MLWLLSNEFIIYTLLKSHKLPYKVAYKISVNLKSLKSDPNGNDIWVSITLS